MTPPHSLRMSKTGSFMGVSSQSPHLQKQIFASQVIQRNFRKYKLEKYLKMRQESRRRIQLAVKFYLRFKRVLRLINNRIQQKKGVVLAEMTFSDKKVE